MSGKVPAAMKILLIRQNYPPERGPVRYTHDLAMGMAKRGHDVTVLTALPHYPGGRPYPGFGRWLPRVRREEHGIRVVRTPLLMASNQQPVKRIAGFFTFAATALPAALLRERPDVIVAAVPPVTVAPVGLALARLRRVPLVMMVLDYEPLRSLEMRGLECGIAAKALIGLFDCFYRRADRIVVTIETEVEAMTARGLDPKRIELLTHGVDVDNFSNLAARSIPFEPARRPGRRLALYTGTVGVAHEVENVIECFARPEIRELPLDLAVVGDGECAPLCARLIAENHLDNVRLYPPAPLEWTPVLQAGADFLLISQQPGLFSVGSKFYEYLAASRPLLANSTGILARTIGRIGNGWVFDARESQSLAAVLQECLAVPEERLEAMGRAGREFARANYNLSSRLDRWEQLLSELSEPVRRAR